MLRRHCILCFCFLLPTVAYGQDSLAASCDSAVTTFEMRQCTSRKLERAKSELQRYLGEARRLALNGKLLDSAQVAWERFRDVECRASGAQYEGGTMQPLVVLSCLESLTRERIRHLYDDYIRTSDSPLPEPKP